MVKVVKKKKPEKEKKPTPPKATAPAKPAQPKQPTAPVGAAEQPKTKPQTIASAPKPTSQVTAAGVPGTQFVEEGKIVTQEAFNQSQLRKQFEAAQLAEQLKQQRFQAQQLEAEGVIAREGEAAAAAEQTGFATEQESLQAGIKEQTAPGGGASLAPPPLKEIIQQDIGKTIKPSGIVNVPVLGEISTSVNDPLGIKQASRLLSEPGKEIKRIIKGTELGLSVTLTPTAIKQISSSTFGAKVLSLTTKIPKFAKGFLQLAIGGALLDLNGGTIRSLRKEVRSASPTASSIQSSVQAGGLSPEEGQERIKALIESVNEAEAAIKQAAIHNAVYKFDAQHYDDEAMFLEVRTNLGERLGAINTIALQGRPQLQPEDAMLALGE